MLPVNPRFLISLAAVSLTSVPALAQPTCTLPVTAYLTDAAETPLDGAIDVELRFYLEPGDEVPAAECRTFDSVEVTNGWMRVPVDACSAPGSGDCGALPLVDLMRGAEGLFVGVLVDGDELGPRMPIGAVPFAVQAADANTLQGNRPDAFEPSGAITEHAANPDAHHSSTSDGLDITPNSVSVGGTFIEDGEVDFGAEADDELTAEMVQTLTGGGDADALHLHPAGHGAAGGGCYIAVGLATCGEGYTAMYSGSYVDSITHYSTGLSQSQNCIADAAISGFVPEAGHLQRWLITAGGSSGNENLDLVDERLLCAMCCP